MRPGAWRSGIGALLLCAMAGFVWLRLEVSTELAHFLDDGTERDLAAVSRRLLDTPLTRTMILSIEGADRAQSLTAARELEAALAAHPEVAAVRSGPATGTGRAVHGLYFPHRLALLSSDPEHELPARLSDAGLREAARRLARELALPSGDLVKRIAPADPLLAFDTLLRRFEQARVGALEISGGRFVSGRRALLFVETVHSAFEAAAQRPLDAYLRARFAEIALRADGDLELERSAAHRFAVESASRAQADASLISGISLLGIVLLFSLVFRSPRVLLAAFVPLLAGVLAATCVGLLAFGRLHVLTLVFGSTLIGVCIDYPVHVLAHQALDSGGGSALAALRRVRPALLMGAGTTVAGFAGIAGAGLPGVRELGVFAGVGVVAALLATLVWLPWLVPPVLHPSRLGLRCGRALVARLDALAERRGLLWIVPALALGTLAVGLPRVVWLDDVFALDVPADPERLEEEQRVRALVSRMDAGRFVVAMADTTQAALALNDRLFLRLEAARTRGLLEDFQSLHPFLFSAELQRRNLEVLRSEPALVPRLEAALEAAGFRPAAFTPFADALRSPPERALELDDVLASPLRDWVSGFHVELEGGRVAVLTLVRGVEDADALAAALADLDGVHFFDQRSFLGELYGRYRERTLELLGVGLVAVLALLLLRYRDPRRAGIVLVPPLLAASFTLALLALAGVAIHLLHVLGLLLVLSIGADYSIFLTEARGRRDDRAATLVCLGIACTSTLLGFGLLALSAFPALSGLGTATGIGVLAALLLAPVVLAFDRGER